MIIPNIWPGKTVVILAGGPSLRTQNLSRLTLATQRDTKLLAVNDSWRLLQDLRIATSRPFKCQQCDGSGGAPNNLCSMCDGVGMLSSCVSYFCDSKWWQQSMAANKRTLDNTYSFHDAIYKLWWFTGSPDFAGHPQVHSVRLTGQLGLEVAPSGLRHGSNAGYQAINLAVHFGAKKIVLLGYDMRMQEGRTHWHNEPRPDGFADVLAQSMLPHFATLVEPLEQLGIEVINATPDSALECFPKMSLEDALTS